MDIFKDKKYNKQKLLNFGFVYKNKRYQYNCPVLDNQFELFVYVKEDGEVSTKLIDKTSDELYTLHLLEGVKGSFVGKIREEYINTLENIAKECFELDVFKYSQTRRIMSLVEKKFKNKFEYPWKKYQNNAIIRRKDNKKWYAVILTVNADKLGFQIKEEIEIINLRVKDAVSVADKEKIFPAYHMNKKYWISIVLNDTLNDEEIMDKINNSYTLVGK